MADTFFAARRCAAALLLALTCSLAQAAPPVPLRLIAFNDLHGNLEATGLTLTLPDPAAPGQTVQVPAGGAANLGGLIKALRTGAPNNLVFSGGDLYGASPLISSLFRHESTMEVANANPTESSS